MFKFKRVKIKNFLSIKDVDLVLEKRGLTLIEGKNTGNSTFESNGSGKSTILNSITYALYGQTSYGLRADDVVNRQEDKDTAVILYIEVDGQAYRIERYRKHKTHKNKVKLFQGKTELTGKSTKDTDKQIQDLFGVDYNTYMNSIVQGQGEAEVFSKASDKGKKEILENITNIAIYKKAQDIAKEKVKERNLDREKIDRDIEETKRHLVNLQDRVDEEKESYQETLNSIKETENKIIDLEEELSEHMLTLPEGLEDRLSHLTALEAPRLPQRPEMTSEELKLQEKLDNTSNHLETSIERITKEHKDEIETLKGKKRDIDNQVQPVLSNLSVLKSDVSRKKGELNNLDLSNTCPTCGQEVNKEHIADEYHRINSEILETEENINYIENVYHNELIPLVNNLETDIREKENKFDELVGTTRKQYQKEMDAIQTDIRETREAIEKEARDRFESEQLEHRELMYERDQLQKEKHAFESKKGNIEYSIKSEKSMLERLNALPKPKDRTQAIEELTDSLRESHTEKLACLDKIEKYEDVVKIYSNAGVRSVVLDLVTPFLNEKANEYMATLSGSDIEILFTTQTQNKDGSTADKFDIEIRNNNGGNLYKANSEGEKKRIDLAISFAIQDLVLSKSELRTNIALYDEVFEGLDEIGSENVIKLLRERQEKVESIFVITHNSHLKSMFENVITVEKKDGFTHLISE